MVLVKMLSKNGTINNHKCSFRNKSREKSKSRQLRYCYEIPEKCLRIMKVRFSVRSSLLQKQILMFCSTNVMRLFQNAGKGKN